MDGKALQLRAASGLMHQNGEGGCKSSRPLWMYTAAAGLSHPSACRPHGGLTGALGVVVLLAQRVAVRAQVIGPTCPQRGLVVGYGGQRGLALPVALSAQGAGLQKPGAALHSGGAACPLEFCGLGWQAVRQLVQARLEGCQSHRVRLRCGLALMIFSPGRSTCA
jgi:hypothetical protein